MCAAFEGSTRILEGRLIFELPSGPGCKRQESFHLRRCRQLSAVQTPEVIRQAVQCSTSRSFLVLYLGVDELEVDEDHVCHLSSCQQSSMQ